MLPISIPVARRSKHFLSLPISSSRKKKVNLGQNKAEGKQRLLMQPSWQRSISLGNPISPMFQVIGYLTVWYQRWELIKEKRKILKLAFFLCRDLVFFPFFLNLNFFLGRQLVSFLLFLKSFIKKFPPQSMNDVHTFYV